MRFKHPLNPKFQPGIWLTISALRQCTAPGTPLDFILRFPGGATDSAAT